MTTLARPSPDAATHTESFDARLWAALTRPSRRRPAVKGLDIVGEAVTGWWARRRAKRLDWVRAKSIIAAARALSHSADAQLDQEIADVRSEVMVRHDDPRVVDHAFTLIYEVVRREIGLAYHVEQILGALALAGGCCAELATGEGKTITAIPAAAAQGWTGRGVHVITVNDYLARRDAEICEPAYRRLGLSLGVIQDSSSQDERRAAYAADITYAADKQVLFDHLRDRLIAPVQPRLTGLLLDQLTGLGHAAWGDRVVQRGLYAAIVDEADSVLIDDAVTPAIISGPAPQNSALDEHYRTAALLAQQFNPNQDFLIDARARMVVLTQRGRARLADLADRLPPFWAGPRRREELLVQALTAATFYKRGEDYVVVDKTIEIIDRSTGRVLPGRQWQLGVHQAVEAKEGLPLTAQNITIARSSYQHFFQRYQRLSGMTGTAREVAEELWLWYRLPVVAVPTHKRVIRRRAPDRIFSTEAEKLEAAADRVARVHARGRPILVGTWSITTSERMAALIRSRGVACNVLNASREREEAEIIAQAGLPGAVTVATNMAGRGTDIRLSEESRRAGGLLVVATERNDESRVDRQLAGRAGRQGDPGAVEPFVSLEDRLIVQHGLTPLIRAVSRTRGPLRTILARLLWWSAQRTAGRRWAVLRSQAVKADAWFDMAWHQVSR